MNARRRNTDFPPLSELPAMLACYALVLLLAVMVACPDLVLRVLMAVIP